MNMITLLSWGLDWYVFKSFLFLFRPHFIIASFSQENLFATNTARFLDSLVKIVSFVLFSFAMSSIEKMT